MSTISNPYGYFDAEAREYVIVRPDTPTPWLNYLGQGGYGGIISNTAGGYSFDRDPRSRRVTRYRYNAIPADQPGRYVYLRDQESGEYWSPTWQPVTRVRLDVYECHHGAGYTRIRGEHAGIQAELLYFVPPLPESGEGPGVRASPPLGAGEGPGVGVPHELWVLRLRNASDRPRRLRTFTYAEFCYWDALTDQQNLDWGQQIMQARCRQGIITSATQFRPTTTFFASSRPPVGFETDREAFVGRGRDLSNPQVVESGEPGNTEAPRGNNIGCLCHDLALAPGEEAEIVYVLGVTDHPQAIPAVVARASQPGAVEAALAALRADWDAYLDTLTVHVPDPEMEAMLNTWNPIQCRANLYWSRFVSGYDTGLGRGMGTRDSAQDTLGTVQAVPGQVRQVLSILWKLQFADGHTWHQVFPLTGEGGPGLAGEHPDWPQWFSDDHLWLIIATCHYLRETGDLAYLEEAVPYQDAGAETVWQHVLRAVDFTLAQRGPHGLPRLGFADWDDTMNLDHGSGLAESVWTAMQFCRAMLDLAELCRFLGRVDDAVRFAGLHQEMAAAVQAHGWDGAWYRRAYDDAGLPVGVSVADQQRIALNPQTWAVIGELGDRGRAAQAMEQAHALLNTPFGLRLMWPPYTGFSDRVHGTTTYPPGAKENGGIFCHANAWAIVAAAALGWGDRAYQYYRQILPLARTDTDTLLTEPYVFCQNICAPEHPHYGRGRNSWLTGTAAWTYVAATQWILGIRPEYYGLRLAPVIPGDWPGFTARRVFRGVTYRLTVERRGPGNAVSLAVDGRQLAGDIVPFPPPGQTEVAVQVRLL